MAKRTYEARVVDHPNTSVPLLLLKGAENVRVPHQLVILAILIFSAAGTRLLPDMRDHWSSAAASRDTQSPGERMESLFAQAESNEALNGIPTERLVQEPSRRTSKRPQLGNSLQYGNQRTSMQMLSAFREAIGSSWQSTVELLVNDERVSYGAVVDRKGFVITKDSQLPRGERILCRFYDRAESPAEIVDRNTSLDIALLRVDAKELTPIQWADETLPQRGNWLATTDTHTTPVAVGVVSSGLLSVSAKKAVLGVKLTDDKTQGASGALIAEVMTGTGADMAGLRRGDRIMAIDGKQTVNQDNALKLLRTCTAGQKIKLAIARGEDQMETTVQLMDLSPELHDETEMEVNGQISARSNGFSTVMLHDTVLNPNQCGGPLVNLEGRVVGINIARAGRVSSYALPVSAVRPEVDRMIASARSALQTLPARAVIER